MANDKKQLGKILLKQKLISQADLDNVLQEQQRAPLEEGKPLASRLTQSGLVSETNALRALSEQFGFPAIDLNQVAILLEHLEFVPRDMAESQKILPVLVRDDRIFLAMANPMDKRVIDELEFVTGRKVYPYIAITHTLEKTSAEAYDAKNSGKIYFVGPNVPRETLDQLGLADRDSQPPSRASRPSIVPGGSAVIIDEAIESAGNESELSDQEFGNMSADVSTVTHLPDELRVAAGQMAASLAQEAAPAPAPAPAVAPPLPPRPKTGSTSSKLILIVDDEEDIRKLLRTLLANKGHRVLEADRGLLALRMVKEHRPDLIVLDAMLPELHGFDIARRIKGSEKYGNIPIIMISAVYRGWRIAEDLKTNYGIEEYLEKPFRISDVIAAVTKLLARHTSPTVPPPRDPENISSDAEKALEQGIAAFRAGNIDLAIEHLQRGVKIDPLAYRLRYHLALLYGKKGQVYDGVSELERAVELNPKHFPALKNLAVLYEKAGFKHKAVEMWERCVHAAPDAPTRASIKEHLVRLL